VKSITIHKLNQDLYNTLADLAHKQGTSINRLVKKILRESLGLEEEPRKKRGLSFIVGSMSEQELTDFDEAISTFDKIDQAEW